MKDSFISYVDLAKQWKEERKDLLKLLDKTLSEGKYVGGNQVDKLEKNIAKFLNVKYVVSLNSGTDALTLALHCLGLKKNDEVITPPNSFIASTAVITHLGLKPKFVDILDDQNIDPSQIEKNITKKTKAIMPVHLTGRICRMKEILKIAKKYNLKVIEDSAQAFGSKLSNRHAGTFGDVGCFSTHPLKNLNSVGDGGFMVTNNKSIYERARILRNHGTKDRNVIDEFGFVSRLDTIQAVVLDYRLKKVNGLIKKRRKNVSLYKKYLTKKIFIPSERKDEFNSYHTFVVQTSNRDQLKKYLIKKGIETAIHYPIPIHLQPSAKKIGHKEGDFIKTEQQSKRILTLPIHQYLKESDIFKISQTVNNFFK